MQILAARLVGKSRNEGRGGVGSPVKRSLRARAEGGGGFV